MRKDDRGYITIELDGSNYNINQRYTISNNTIRNQDILYTIEEWHKDILHLHKDDETSYKGQCQQELEKLEAIRCDEVRKRLSENGALRDMVPPAQQPEPEPAQQLDPEPLPSREQVEGLVGFIQGNMAQSA